MTKKPKTKRKATNTNGKDASPRGGLKSKQTRVSDTKETSTAGPKQTKLSFAPTTTAPTPPRVQADPTAVISPEVVARAHPNNNTTTKTTSDTESPETTTTKIQAPSKIITQETTTPDSKQTPPIKTRFQSDSNDEHKTDLDDGFTIVAKPVPAAKPPGKYKEIRYRGIIETPPSSKPFKDFVDLLKKYLKTVQTTLGKSIYLAPWDKEQEATFPLIETPSSIPESRESLGIYLGTYINPKEEGSKIYMNLRLVTYSKPPVPLERFGLELSDALPKLKMSINKQPQPCQAAKSSCIGWFMYSTKQINSTAFVNETKIALGIPPEVPIGISYRTIVNEFGKRPQYNRDDPPAAAIHLDIDERFYMVYQPKASSLWRKNSKKRLPNGVQLRLVPCFSSPIGKSLTDEIRADAKTLAQRQYYFVKEHIRTIEYHFISLLDTPLSKDNPLTLRRAMMSRPPKDCPVSRLIHNVDQAWNQTSKYIVTTVVGREQEANRFLSNLIPEILHVHGPEATKWFTTQGISVYKDVSWNPKKGTTSSSNAKASAAMVEEDLWDLGEEWKTLAAVTTKTGLRPDTSTLDDTPAGQATTQNAKTAPTPSKILERLAGDKSVASFGVTFGREHDSDDEKEAATLAAEAALVTEDLSGTQFVFSSEQMERERERALLGSESEGRSMSTAGKTTASTRLKLKEAEEQIAELKLALAAQAATPKAQLKPAPDARNTDLPESLSSTSMADDTTEPEEDTHPRAMESDEEPRDIQLL